MNVLLMSEKINNTPSPCCYNGLYLDFDSGYPQLSLLPPVFKELCLTKGEHFGKLSAKYNKILCIGSTCVENTHNGGYEQIVGDHPVKMNGRSYHFPSKDMIYHSFSQHGFLNLFKHAIVTVFYSCISNAKYFVLFSA